MSETRRKNRGETKKNQNNSIHLKKKYLSQFKQCVLPWYEKCTLGKNILKSIMNFLHELAGLLNKPCGKLWCLIIILNFLYDVGIFIPLICCGLFSLRVWVPEGLKSRARFPDSLKYWKCLDSSSTSALMAPLITGHVFYMLPNTLQGTTTMTVIKSSGGKIKSTLWRYTIFPLNIKTYIFAFLEKQWKHAVI